VRDLRAQLFAPRRDPFWGATGALLLSLLISFTAIALSGRDALAGFGDLLSGAFGGPGPLGETAIKTSVLLLTGLSVAVAFTVGLFNIGAEGQLIWGALAAAVVGQLDVPGIGAWSILAAALAGGAWGAIPGLLKVTRGVHEVISTILLNWVAIHLVHGWLVPGPLAAEGSGHAISIAGTAPISVAAYLPRPFAGSRFDLGFAIALAAAAGVWFLLTRTWRGFEWRAVGAGREAAEASGIPARRRICEAMSLSGALSGIAGALLILGTEHRFPGVFRTGYGFDGIAVALLGRSNPIGIVFASLLFGAMRAGAGLMQINAQIPPELVDVLQATILLFLVASPVLRRLFRLRGAKGMVDSATFTRTYGGGTEVAAQ